MYIINTIPHGKCFVQYLCTRFCIRNLTRSLRSLVRFLTRQQLVRKYRTPALSMKYSLFADDTLIHSTCEADRDSSLYGFTRRCQQKGVKLNAEKLEYKCKEVPCHGHLLTTEGLKPDPEKVRAIGEMTRPKDRGDILRLNGMVI